MRATSFGECDWMLHLDAIEPERDERFDALARASRAGVRQDRETAGGVHHRDRLAHPQLILGDVRRTSRAEIAVERVAHIGRPAVGHQRARDVRSADGAGRRPAAARRRASPARLATAAARRCAPRVVRASRGARPVHVRAPPCRSDGGRGGASPRPLRPRSARPRSRRGSRARRRPRRPPRGRPPCRDR